MPRPPVRTVPVLLALCAASAFACHTPALAVQPAADASCVLGPPPGSAGFAEHNARQAAEIERNGFLQVCDALIERYDVASQLKPAMPRLAFQPVALAGTPFAHYQDVGKLAEPVGGILSRLYRGFRTPEGYMLTLFEHDMSADGSQMTRAPQDEPERIRGMPARLMSFETRSGKAVSVLSWLEGRRYYELWIDANAARKRLQPHFIALAATLPKSVPAKNSEKPPGPIIIGPDGMPQVPMPPAILPGVAPGQPQGSAREPQGTPVN